MATCPDCGGFLHAQHRCSGVYRRLAIGLVIAASGAVVGSVAVYGFVDHPALDVVAIGLVLGAILFTSVWRTVAL